MLPTSSRSSCFALLLAGLVTFAQSYTTPIGDPKGNPITKPGLNELVPAGKPFTITWAPTTPTDATVTILLLRGPSSNILPLYPIVEKTQNTGTYTWTPSTNLEPDTTHYGIQLIVDATGQYQYSTQFGISNPAYVASSSTSGTSTTSSGHGVATSTRLVHFASSSTMPVLSTGFLMGNSSAISATGIVTVPTSVVTYRKPTVSTEVTVVLSTETGASSTGATSAAAQATASNAASIVDAAAAFAGVAVAAVLAF